MPIYKIPYGKSGLTINLPEDIRTDWIAPPTSCALENPEEAVRQALSHPINSLPLDGCGMGSAAIAINDKTRPVPHHVLLPPLLDYLEQSGIPARNITLFVATGTHLPMSSEEIRRLLPQAIMDRVRVVSHHVDDLSNYVHLGYTSRGTPIMINRQYYQADFRLVVGDIELHHFAGFSGGVKSAVIGLGSRESIQHNHRMLIEEKAVMGVYEDNPLRQDIEESGDRIGIHYALNAVLDEEKKVVSVFFGNPRDIMKAGIPVARGRSEILVNDLYDVVIASAGGYPKDINFYQAQKAITHASLFAKPGGVIILAAECIEGSGSAGFEDFMRGVTSLAEIFDNFSRMGFVVGPHKALQVARQLQNHRIILVSGISPGVVEKWLITPAETVETALHLAGISSSSTQRLAILPHATGVIPIHTTTS